MTTRYIQSNTLFLAGSGTIIGATSITLTTLTDIYGNVLTMTDFGAKGYITLEPDTTNEEAATFTGITANANGTYTLTGVKTGLAKSPYTETSGLIRQHAGGTKVVITDSVQFWNTFGNVNNTNTWADVQTFSVPAIQATEPTSSTQVANKSYVDGVAIGGGANASSTVKGISKLSVDPASATNPIAVGDNDTRVPSQGENDALVGTSGTPSSSNKYVTNDDTSATSSASKVVRANASGIIDPGFLTGTENASYTYGETIAIGDALYLKASDGKVYKTDGGSLTEKVTSFVGIATQAGNANDVKNVQVGGRVTGLSGLVAGTEYMLAEAGSTDTGTTQTDSGSDYPVGRTFIQYYAKQITVTKPSYLASVTYSLKKASSPTTTISVGIYQGLPATGTTFIGLVGSIQTLAESSLTTSYANYTFTFNQLLMPGTYYIGISSSNNSDNTNYSMLQGGTVANDATEWITNSGNWQNNNAKKYMSWSFTASTFTAGQISSYFATYRKVIGVADSTTSLLLRPRRTTSIIVSKNENTVYTAETDGVLMMKVPSGKSGTIYINGTSFNTTTGPSSNTITTSIPVKKNDTYIFYNASTGLTCGFIPEI